MRRLIVIATLFCSASAAAQFNSLGYRWVPPGPINYSVYYDISQGENFGLTNVRNAVDGAWAVWNIPSCSWLKSNDTGGVVDHTTENPADLTSAMPVWVSSSSDPNYNFALGGGSQAAAAIPFTFAGQIYACDIFVNAFDYVYSVADPPAPTALDLQTALAHEVGHCLGLGDEYTRSDLVMYEGPLPGQIRRQLTSVDQQDLCQAYPSHGYGSTCTGTGQGNCSSGLNCVDLGGPVGRACTVGCTPPAPNGPNPCSPPFVCLASAAVPGFSGVCSSNSAATTLVGNGPCTSGDISHCGSASAACIPQGTLPGNTIAWSNGYCSQVCNATTACPAGSVCQPGIFGANGGCLEECQLGGAGCRQYYACSPLTGLPSGIGACVSACANDADCAGGSCRGCDGVCFNKNTATSQIGDSCQQDGECGVGQYCLKFGSHPEGVCTQTCSVTCGACPSGTDCQSVNGSLVCLRDCENYTCQAGEQCQYFPNGRGCTSECTYNNECPSGYQCTLGQCSPTSPVDAGCELCFIAPTDSPPTGNNLDAGVSGINTGGCGCQVGSGIVVLPLFIFAFSLWERRRWQRR